MVQRIDVDEAIGLVAGGAALIDVLPAELYAREHLPGAHNIPLEALTEADLTRRDRDGVIVLYCFDQH